MDLDFEEYDSISYTGDPRQLAADTTNAVWTDHYIGGSSRIFVYNFETNSVSKILHEDHVTGLDDLVTVFDSTPAITDKFILYQSYDSESKISSIMIYHMHTKVSVSRLQ